MKRILSNYRYYVLIMLAVATTFGIFSEPSDCSMEKWVALFIASKAIGILSLLALYLLCRRWDAGNKIPELSNFINN